jgi:hypothetical protein
MKHAGKEGDAEKGHLEQWQRGDWAEPITREGGGKGDSDNQTQAKTETSVVSSRVKQNATQASAKIMKKGDRNKES